MYASFQCPPCHALIDRHNIYERLNQRNSLPTGSSWLQERQNQFGNNFRRGRLCASRRVLLRDTWKQLLMNGIELHCDTLILLCRGSRAPDGSKLNGVVPVAKQCDPKENTRAVASAILSKPGAAGPGRDPPRGPRPPPQAAVNHRSIGTIGVHLTKRRAFEKASEYNVSTKHNEKPSFLYICI
jgi:hypothetical protein